MNQLNLRIDYKLLIARSLLKNVNPPLLFIQSRGKSGLACLHDSALWSKCAPVLSAGENVGTGDLDIEVAKTLGWDGSFTLNNHGSRHTGDLQGRINLGLNRLVNFGDRLSLSVLRSNGEYTLGEMSYGFAMGGSGLRGEVSSSRNDYALGADFMGIGGHSETQSITLSYPVFRSSQTNLTASLGREKGAMSDGLNGVSFDDKMSRVSSVSLQFDHGDALGGGGLTFGNFTYSHGDIGSTSAAAVQGLSLIHI